MSEGDVLRRVRATRIVPVVRASSPAAALPLCEAMHAAGLAVEVTLTIPGATGLIARLAQAGMPVGAGSVLDAQAARACIAAGARFVVSPALDLALIRACRDAGVAVFAGAMTPTEIVQAWQAGADLVKVFPIATLGGARYLRALRGPLPQVPLLPTGGVTLDDVPALLEAGAVAVGADAQRIGDPQAWLGAARAARSSEGDRA